MLTSKLPPIQRVTWLAVLLPVTMLLGCRPTVEPATVVPVVDITTVQVQQRPQQVRAPGSIEPVQSSWLSFRVAGQVLELVDDGAVVTAGQVLATLDDTALRHELEIAQAKANEVAQRHARLQGLYEAGSLTLTNFEKSRTARDETAAALAMAQDRLDHTRLIAPFAGRVAHREVGSGAVVAPGAPVLQLFAPAPVWAVVHVPEARREHLAVGAMATVELLASQRTLPPAVVESLGAQVDRLARTVEVKIRLPNADGMLQPGAVVSATIQTDETRSGLWLPPEAVHREADGSLFVWLLPDDGDRVTKKRIAAGTVDSAQVEITTGLRAGDRIVLRSTAALFEASRVAISGS